MKAKQLKKLQHRQAGFTLLELLVVITLIATLATAALVAYEGIGENAEASAESNNVTTLDGAIRNFRAVTGSYPDQWDSLVLDTSAASPASANIATETQNIIVGLDLSGVTPSTEIRAALDDVGIEELQYANGTLSATVPPNLAHNEGANGTQAPQYEVKDSDASAANDVRYISILPMGTSCNIAGGAAGSWDDSLNAKNYPDAQAKAFQSIINDELGEAGNGNGCNLIAAFGFGHDAAHSTTESSVAIAQAPTFTSANINPARNYARYIGLFLIGSDDGTAANTANTITAAEIRAKAKLIGVISPEGRVIDQALSVAKQAN
ncbi:type II secretion system protein [Methylomonas sp. 11b]|uniref:type II secretion system protein n=1 Tax=Methylomonas sp. 11b TaxID=1168169 RepID=UPI00047C5A6B|nr:type II secretion system protein [Methylomonas sp. 11b]